MKFAIGALVRGYADNESYDTLILRNQAIKNVLIKKLKMSIFMMLLDQIYL